MNEKNQSFPTHTLQAIHTLHAAPCADDCSARKRWTDEKWGNCTSCGNHRLTLYDGTSYSYDASKESIVTAEWR